MQSKMIVPKFQEEKFLKKIEDDFFLMVNQAKQVNKCEKQWQDYQLNQHEAHSFF